MANRTVNIGLSLGADICWPICYETLLAQLDLDLELDGERLKFHCERITIEPFNLRQPVKYDLVIDRLTHWYSISREWIKKAILLNDLYVYNNPWSIQANEKHTSYCAMMRLGLPIPDTWMLPAKSYARADDLEATLRQYARLFSLTEIGNKVGYPFFLKPYHGGGWKGVVKVDDLAGFQKAYDESGVDLMNAQAAVLPYEWFVRCVGLGPQLRKVNYDPGAALHDRYRMDHDFLPAEDQSVLEDMTLTINAFFGWDFNSCEALKRNSTWHPIDFANPCPDSQVTALHYHFPWLIKANLRWSIFCAATDRAMQRNMGWAPYFEIADREDLDLRDRLRAYAALAHERFETDKFRDFCRTHLGHLDELAYEYFGSPVMRDAIHQKVAAVFPPHEIEEFTELFWGRVQRWRELEGVHGDPDGF